MSTIGLIFLIVVAVVVLLVVAALVALVVVLSRSHRNSKRQARGSGS